ncbi:hypothetical protein PR202_ga11025 [Eleusine coracana subsp. coracana]|uniref:DUF6598 domain-containing protein n=1 Tax=Eleusine coracana subsp. coracana TaxID=191504 RepID=A0AAV5C8G6_ELECO|nr:hypothetical protein PR202_ga11025 [Eleusine coracana subsp. coracana]
MIHGLKPNWKRGRVAYFPSTQVSIYRRERLSIRGQELDLGCLSNQSAAAAMEIETETAVLGHRIDRPLQPVADLSSRALTPAEEMRKAYYAAQGKEVEVRRMMEEDDDDDDDEEMVRDYYAFKASRFRESWEAQCFGYYGFFEDTSPIRAVVMLDPVTFEVDLKVKGTTEAEDKHLSFLAVPFRSSATLPSWSLKRGYTSKLSTLEFALGLLDFSLEATITVRVTHGSWPNGYRAQFAARTASIDHEEIILLDSRDNEVPIAGDGWITLSRRVASVEVDGKLKVAVKALLGDDTVVTKERFFSPKKAGKSVGTLNVGFCRMDVTVAWSLVSSPV